MWPIIIRGGSWPPSSVDVGSVTAALLLAAAVIFIPRVWSSSRTRRPQVPASGGSTAGGARLPAGSLGWPLLGETLAFIRAAYSPRPESFVEKRRLWYGKVFKSHLWGSPAVVSSDPEVSRAVLQADASAFVPWYPRSLICPGGLVSSPAPPCCSLLMGEWEHFGEGHAGYQQDDGGALGRCSPP